MDASTALQVDTGDLILGLRGLEKSAEQQSPVEETGAAVELCNNLILYPRVCYDGNIHKESRDEIKQLIERLADGIQDSDTKSLFVNKFLPIPLSQEQESSLVLQSATEAVSFLNVVEKLLSIPASSNNPVYQKEPFSNLDQFLALLRSPSIPEPASIDFFFSDRKIKGGRFFWALLHDQCFGPIAKYIAAKPHEANQRLLVVFWRYRYRFAANRGQEIYGKDLAFKGGCYYHPGRERQT